MRITIQIDTDSGTVDLQKADEGPEGGGTSAGGDTGSRTARSATGEGARDAGRGPSKPPAGGAPPANTSQSPAGAEGPSGGGEATSAGAAAALGSPGQGATGGED